jgi:hypothetical protein
MILKKDIVGALLLLVLLVAAIIGVRSQVSVTWRLVPVQQSIILPPALGNITLTPGDKLVQRFSVPADTAAFLTTPSSLMVSFSTPPGKTPPDVRMTLRNAAGNTLGNWLIPSSAVAGSAITIPIVDVQAAPGTHYALELEDPLASTTGAPQGNVSLAYTPNARPRDSSLSLSGRAYPGTLGLTISHQVPLWTYLAHYPSLLLRGHTLGWAVWLGALQLLWLLAIAAILGMAATLVLTGVEGPLGAQPQTRHATQSRGGRQRGKSARQPVTSKGRR